MSVNIPDKILGQIQALFTLAKDGRGNVNEQAAAAAKAQYLLAKYKLEMSDVVDSDVKTAAFKIVVFDLAGAKGKRSIGNWARILAHHISRNNFCDVLTYDKGLRFIGAESDLPTVTWLYSYLKENLERLATQHWEREKMQLENLRQRFAEDTPNKRAGVTWKNNFLMAAVGVIGSRLEEARKQSEIDAVSERQMRLKREAEEAYRNGTRASALTRLYETWEQSTQRALAPWREAEERVQDFIKRKYEIRNPQMVYVTPNESAKILGAMTGAKISLNKPLSAHEEPKVVPAARRLN